MSIATMKLTIDIDIELHRQLKAHCAATGVSLKDFVTEGAIARLRMQGQSVSREVVERSVGTVDSVVSGR
jgi:ATP-dependent 26S proteasome regulatory subunit